RPAAQRERRPHRPRDGALPRRSRDQAAGDAPARTACPALAAVDRRRRRVGLDARAKRALPGSAALLAPRAEARHAGRPEVLPPRDDRALSRPASRRTTLVRACARAEPALLRSLDFDREEVHAVRRVIIALCAACALAVPAAASAHPLGNFTINH